MKLSTKLTILILAVAFLVSFTSSARAVDCTLTVEEDAATANLFRFRGTCPTGYQDTWSLRVDGDEIDHGSSAADISFVKIYTTSGSYTANLRCQTLFNFVECSDTFSVVEYATCGAFVQPGQICPPECPFYDSGTKVCKVATSLSCGSVCTDSTANQCPASCPCKQTIPYANMYCGDPPTPTPTPDPGGPSTPDEPCNVNGKDGIKTGLGCIPTDPTGLVNKILQIAIGVSSGIALLLLISGAFKILTSSGDPKAIMGAKDTITSAIGGLLLILLSVAILNIIGINILNIPIWGTP